VTLRLQFLSTVIASPVRLEELTQLVSLILEVGANAAMVMYGPPKKWTASVMQQSAASSPQAKLASDVCRRWTNSSTGL
jgi:hypothetical protein